MVRYDLRLSNRNTHTEELLFSVPVIVLVGNDGLYFQELVVVINDIFLVPWICCCS